MGATGDAQHDLVSQTLWQACVALYVHKFAGAISPRQIRCLPKMFGILFVVVIHLIQTAEPDQEFMAQAKVTVQAETDCKKDQTKSKCESNRIRLS